MSERDEGRNKESATFSENKTIHCKLHIHAIASKSLLIQLQCNPAIAHPLLT